MSAKKKPQADATPETTPPVVEAVKEPESGPIRGFEGRHMVIGKDNHVREGRMETIKI